MALLNTRIEDSNQKFEPIVNNNLWNYENDAVISKFRDEWDISEEDSKDIFLEMKKFLYISSITQTECFNMDVSESMLIIDKMWHTFVLFTKEYSSFCEEFFGKFLHHAPFSKSDLKQRITNLSKKGKTLSEGKSEHLKKQLSYIQKYMGEETVKKWYINYAIKYPPKIINSLQKPAFHEGTEIQSKTLSSEDTLSLNPTQLIDKIIQEQKMSLFCGTNCGAYCSCNSGNIFN
jgi:hypothetical protein